MEENLFDSANSKNIKEDFFKYLSYWYLFLFSFMVFLIGAYIYVRYTENLYEISAKIEIIDKSQDSEMALPTAMTIFNRSMINLDNEIGVLNSYKLNERVVTSLRSNIEYYSIGRIKKNQRPYDLWIPDYEITFNDNIDSYLFSNSFEILLENKSSMKIDHFDHEGDIIHAYSFNSNSTSLSKHDLPFELNILSFDEKENHFKLVINPIENTTNKFRNWLKVEPSGELSDQLNITLKHPNIEVGLNYLNEFITQFDNDGIYDRQLEYKRTIDFVDSRSEFLKAELEVIENRKEDFKTKNKLTDIGLSANVTINQQFSYNEELFKALSQRDLVKILKENIIKDDFNLLPMNIGLENNDINSLIENYNKVVSERNRYLNFAGKNNLMVKNLEKELRNFLSNLLVSIDSYEKTLEIKIAAIEKKEIEFEDLYLDIPKNEKILRSIERELQIKEALFLLLLQKREEAAINFAVVKPSIKIIDPPIAQKIPVSPNPFRAYLFSSVISFLIVFIILYIKFLLDTKIHTKEHLSKALNDEINIIAEIPYVKDNKLTQKIISSDIKNQYFESFSILSSNFKFINKLKDGDGKVILVTSSIKGEGKTFVSTNFASSLSRMNKVLLIGCDLRNPQIHKFINKEKNTRGLSDIYYEKSSSISDVTIKINDNFDMILSGNIPPNPSEILNSDYFDEVINKCKKLYDFVIIDTAPCILVSDTLDISDKVDYSIFVVRSNYTDKKLIEFINDSYVQNKLKNISLVLNGVGNSSDYNYAYKYSYGYSYTYNYGYGYGYSSIVEDDEK